MLVDIDQVTIITVLHLYEIARGIEWIGDEHLTTKTCDDMLRELMLLGNDHVLHDGIYHLNKIG